MPGRLQNRCLFALAPSTTARPVLARPRLTTTSPLCPVPSGWFRLFGLSSGAADPESLADPEGRRSARSMSAPASFRLDQEMEESKKIHGIRGEGFFCRHVH
jgi:hypothetical protein